MNPNTQPAPSLADEEVTKLADDFETREFTPAELTKIKRTRRRKPRLGEAKAEVYTFRAPPNYNNRIKSRANSDAKTESQVIETPSTPQDLSSP